MCQEAPLRFSKHGLDHHDIVISVTGSGAVMIMAVSSLHMCNISEMLTNKDKF